MRIVFSSAPRGCFLLQVLTCSAFPALQHKPLDDTCRDIPKLVLHRTESRDAVLSSLIPITQCRAGVTSCARLSSPSWLSPLSFSSNRGTRLIMSPRHQAHFHPQPPAFQLAPAPGQKELDPFHPEHKNKSCSTD